MEITDFLYIRNQRMRAGSIPLAAGLLLTCAAWGCAGAHRDAATGPRSVPATPVIEQPSPLPGQDRTTPAGEVRHVVQPGQTLWRIARTYGLSPEELARANGIEDPTRVSAGAVLVVPGASRTLEVPPFPAPPGTGSPPGDAGLSADWVWPVRQARILSYYGAPRGGHRHGGIDIDGDHGEPVLAARSGRVVYSGSGMRGYGKTVILDHGDGLSSLYAHNAKLLVRVGQRVEQGTPVALLGRTGNATADHCHFEIRREDRTLDPLLFLLPPLEAQR